MAVVLDWSLKEHISITAQKGDANISHCRPEQTFDFEAPRWVLLCITEILHSYKSVNVSWLHQYGLGTKRCLGQYYWGDTHFVAFEEINLRSMHFCPLFPKIHVNIRFLTSLGSLSVSFASAWNFWPCQTLRFWSVRRYELHCANHRWLKFA